MKMDKRTIIGIFATKLGKNMNVKINQKRRNKP